MTHRAGGAKDPVDRADEGAVTQRPAEDEEVAPRPRVPFGAWPSPITAADVARGRLRIAFPTVIGGGGGWQGGGAGGGHRAAGAKRADALPAPWNARSRVHEFGGLAYLPVPRSSVQPAGSSGSSGRAPRGHAIVVANYADQRLYVAEPDVADGKQEPRPITPDPLAAHLAHAGLLYGDFALAPNRREIWCVQEQHFNGKATRAIVAVPLDGSATEDPSAVRQLVTGTDFFAFPTPSPDGTRLAWISWNHPHMPWDGTELRVAVVSQGGGGGKGAEGGQISVGQGRLVKGGLRESVLAPAWRDNTSLYVVTD